MAKEARMTFQHPPSLRYVTFSHAHHRPLCTSLPLTRSPRHADGLPPHGVDLRRVFEIRGVCAGGGYG